MTSRLSLVLAVVLAFGLVSPAAAQQQDQPKATPNPLVQLLQTKGILTAQEATAINQAPTPAEQQNRLTQLLYSKGIITEEEYKQTAGAEARVASESRTALLPVVAHVSAAEPEPAMAMPPQAPAAPAVIPAVAPVRVLTSEPPKAGGLVPDVKLGSGAKLKLYGFIKATAAYDSSNPYNIGFELPGLGGFSNGAFPTAVPRGGTSTVLSIPGVGNADFGPSGSPTFFVKGTATRMGANFEWPDIAGGNNTLTGRIEADFEGNFSRAQNRNVSNFRTRMLAIRLAWARIDHKFSDSTTGFILAGADWTPFGSSNFANLLETEGGAAFFGSLYERSAQIRLGLWHDFGGSRHFTIGVEPAALVPNFGYLPGDVGVQLGVGERQGTNSARPEVSGRAVFQWQLDKAKGVAPAQIIISGMNARRVEIVNRAAIASAWCGATPATPPFSVRLCSDTTAPNGPAVAAQIAGLLADFPHGATASSQRWGADVGLQLPTRYMTLMTRYYMGADLNWYFASQFILPFNDTRGTGLTAINPATGFPAPCATTGGFCPQVFDIDASAPNVFFGLGSDGHWHVVPQHPPRAMGGQAQISFPLSRIFNANPAGRNAGWVIAFTAGTDQVRRRDVLATSPGGSRDRSDMVAATLTWRINQFATWAYESSVYVTRSTCLTQTPTTPFCAGTLFRSLPARYWHDWRNEFGPIFTF